ncbi:gp28 [Bacillus phage G]|uniref:Gp28 n=1 Tax=Bacillus phage G TaxID=2884420 RepID=G3MB98_9CAUD|nr:gp28 [Bacillus phage G]AEO93299.1 gp28 [Bacillus phage G]
MKCPVCNKDFKSNSLKRHLGLMKDENHNTLYNKQKEIAINLFYNVDFKPNSNIGDFDLLITYKDCKVLWMDTFSESERKERSNRLKSEVKPWNKGLTVRDHRVREMQNKRNETTSKVLREKYKNGEMAAWTKGLKKENNKKLRILSQKISKTMSEREQNNSRGISGIRKDIGHHAASTYEANIYRILQYHSSSYLKEFEIIKKLKRDNGTLKYYRLDIKDIDGVFGVKNAFIEVKGFMKEEDREKIRLFKQQYPNETLMIIGNGDKRENYFWEPDVNYLELEKKYKPLIPLWEDRKQNLRTTPELYKDNE